MADEIQRPRNGTGHGNGHGNTNAHGNGNIHGNGNAHGNANGYGGGGGRILTGGEQLREVLHVLFKRWRMIAALFVVVALPGLAVSTCSKPKYVATAKVLITTQRGDATVQPTDLTKVSTLDLNESAVNSEVHIIRSRQMLDHVVRGLTYGDSNGDARIENVSLQNNGADLGLKVMALEQALVVTPIKSSNVIQIDYKAQRPETAAQVVNRVVDEYLAFHAEVHGNKNLSHFYEEQRRDLEKRLRVSEDALKEFADREGISSPREEIQAAVRAVAELDTAMREINASINGAEEKMRIVQQQFADQPPIIKRYQYLEVNPVVTQLTQQLVDRQIDRVSLLRRYTDKDRHVRDNAEEIGELQDQLDEELRDHPTVVARQMLRTNPVREDRLRLMLDLESSLKELRARRATLEEETVRGNRRLISLRQKTLEYDRLDQEVKNRRDTFELYVKREQEARISEAMDQERLVNVDVVQRPALPLPRTDSQRTSVFLSLISGLAVSFGAAFGLEYLNRSLRSEYDVEQHLGLPLLGSINDYSQA
ncbi:MAG: hypothetical protein HY699_01165 [Deltaproteobacteria bacterium]|nr:hypothetical protein [Deltaproteobacteria bacterium]